MKLGWFHIIGSRRFSRMVAGMRRDSYDEGRRSVSRDMAKLKAENASLRRRIRVKG